MKRLLLMSFLLMSYIAIAGVGDNQSNWEGTCIVNNKKLKKSDFSSSKTFEEYKVYCKDIASGTSKQDKKVVKKDAKDAVKEARANLAETCKKEASQIPSELYPDCCVHLFKLYRRNQSLEQMAITAASVVSSAASFGVAGAATVAAGSIALELIKGPMEKKMTEMKCETHVADYKQFKKLLAKEREKNRLERQQEKQCEKGHEKKCENKGKKLTKLDFEVRCMGIDKNNKDIGDDEKDDCCKILKKKRVGQVTLKVAAEIAKAVAEAGASGLLKALVTKGGLEALIKNIDPKKFIQLNMGNNESFMDGSGDAFQSAMKEYFTGPGEWAQFTQEFGAKFKNGPSHAVSFAKDTLKKLSGAATKAWKKAAIEAGGEAALSALVRDSGKELIKGGKKNESGTDVNILKLRINELQCKDK